MKHLCIVKKITIATMVLSFSAISTVSYAQPQAFKELQSVIAKQARLSSENYSKFSKAIFKGDVIIGEHPDGFGKTFTWDRKNQEIELVMFVNAADPLGVTIAGVKQGDRIQITSVSGIASFTEDKGNPLASSLITLAGVGLAGIATGVGQPELLPIIKAGEVFAQEQFKPTNVKHKRRDAFGVDPGTGHQARQEGGIVISLPLANGLYYSGNGDHKERWIKSNSDRTDDQLPQHVKNAFFPVRGLFPHNTRMLRGDGQIHILAWDHKFEDNAGFYKVFMSIRQPTVPPGSNVVVD